MKTTLKLVHAGVLACAAAACGGDSDTPSAEMTLPPAMQGSGATPQDARRYLTSSVVFGDDTTTYLNVLRALDTQEINYSAAREFPGWSDAWVHDGKVFVADGEAPALTRYTANAEGTLIEDGRINFMNTGAKTAAFWANLMISPTKAYLFVIDAREAVIWNPQTLQITGTMKLPALENRPGGLTLQVPSTDRSSVVRGNRAYVPTLWANFETYSLSDDSVILVIDTETDQVLNTLSVPCPNINVGTSDEGGTLYFSNWIFSVSPTLLQGKPRACARRIKPGSDELDPEWSLTFAGVTGGREAAALRYIGNGKALMSVFLHEQVTITPDADPEAFSSGANWQFWTLDLATKKAEPVAGIEQHSGGYYLTRIDNRSHLFVPSADYASTKALELGADGSVTPRWTAKGWTTRLFRSR